MTKKKHTYNYVINKKNYEQNEIDVFAFFVITGERYITFFFNYFYERLR